MYSFQIENYATIKQLGNKYRLTMNKFVTNIRKEAGQGREHDEKLQNNIARARTKIFEYAFCNDWDYFITFTLDAEKYDRYDLKKFHDDLTQWLRNYYHNGNNSQKIRFLFVPEAHEKKLGETVPAWHIHGLISGIDAEHLTSFDEMSKKGAKKVPLKLLRKGYQNWGDYEKKFGFCSLAPIRSHEGVSKYITKYINKSLDERQKEKGAHLYYCSRGLHHAEIIHTGTMPKISFIPDYSNEYVAVRDFDTLKEALENFVEEPGLQQPEPCVIQTEGVYL